MVVADFIVVTNHEGKPEGNAINKNDVLDFTTMITRNGLSDRGYYGSK